MIEASGFYVTFLEMAKQYPIIFALIVVLYFKLDRVQKVLTEIKTILNGK